MATKDTQLDSLSVDIDGEVYFIKAPPSSGSKLVLKQVEDLEADFDIQPLLQNLELTAGCIRLARYAVTGTEVEKDVDETLAKVAMGLQVAMNDMDRVARTDLLSMFVDGVIFLFFGEESLAWDRFGTSRKGQELLMKMSAVREDSLKHLWSSCTETLASIRVIMARARNEEAAAKNIRFAEDALRFLEQDLGLYSRFWKLLNHSIETIGNCNAIQGLKRWPEADKKKRIMNSPAFIRQIVAYYARWVALKNVCASLHAGLQSVQGNVLSSLAARPRSVEEARKELPKMHEDIEAMLKKQCKDHEEEMMERMRLMGDRDDDF